MHFKSRFFATAAVLVMAAAAVFGSTLQMADEGEEISPISWFKDKETIYFWYSDEDLTNYINSAAVAFGEQREGVRVIPILTSDDEYLETINHATLHSEQVPDAYLLCNDSLETAYLAGLAMEIQDGGSVCNESNFPNAALAAVTYEDRYVGYPMYFETSVLVYNQTYLDTWATQQAEKEIVNADGDAIDKSTGEPVGGGQLDTDLVETKKQEYLKKAVPVTVDDILNIADTFDVPQGVESVMKWDVSDIFYNYWIVGNYMIVGGDSGDIEAETNINNAETIQCLEAYKLLNQFFFMETDDVSYESVVQDFVDGKIVFSVVTTDVVERLETAKEEGKFSYEYGVALMPEISEELNSRSMSVTNAVVVNSYSEHVELANEFAAYLTTECADTLYERTGRMSANKNANADDEVLQVIFEEYADSVPLPKMMETGNFWIQLEVLFAKVWNGEDISALVQELSDSIEIQINTSVLH